MRHERLKLREEIGLWALTLLTVALLVAAEWYSPHRDGGDAGDPAAGPGRRPAWLMTER